MDNLLRCDIYGKFVSGAREKMLMVNKLNISIEGLLAYLSEKSKDVGNSRFMSSR
jgi:hypothetical protein